MPDLLPILLLTTGVVALLIVAWATRRQPRVPPMPKAPLTPYAFCESITAGSQSRWHIRPLTKAGRKTGGGIDTAGLCGRPQVRLGWDIATWDVTEESLAKLGADGVCPACAAAWKEQQAS